MQTNNLEVGSYGVAAGVLLSSFEDECVGHSPQAFEGIVVTRIDAEKVFVCDWHISAHFEGEHTLEQFEEAKNSQEFNFSFSGERELQAGECLDGTDPVLKQQLRKQWQQNQPAIEKLKQVISGHKH